jgi:hypothetical protein
MTTGTLSYHRAPLDRIGFAVLTPVTVAIAFLMHALEPGWWISADVVIALGATYLVVTGVGRLIGLRAQPHRIGEENLELHVGRLWSADVPLDDVRDAVVQMRPVPGRFGLLRRGPAALLAVGGRVDVLLDLRRPVLVRRPIGAPVRARRIAIAVDEPEAFVRAIQAALGMRAATSTPRPAAIAAAGHRAA